MIMKEHFDIEQPNATYAAFDLVKHGVITQEQQKIIDKLVNRCKESYEERIKLNWNAGR